MSAVPSRLRPAKSPLLLLYVNIGAGLRSCTGARLVSSHYPQHEPHTHRGVDGAADTDGARGGGERTADSDVATFGERGDGVMVVEDDDKL